MRLARNPLASTLVLATAVVSVAAGCTRSSLTVAQMTAPCACLRDQVCGSDGRCVRRAQMVSAGLAYACAVLVGGRLKCWGDNWTGQLGLGDTLLRGSDLNALGENLPAVDVGSGRSVLAVGAAGLSESHTCAILDNRQLKCWGEGSYGKLGLGDVENRGDQPGEMGDALPAVALGTGRTVTAVVAGPSHTCAILDNHQLKCFGDNRLGQLGLGDTESRGDQPDEMGDRLPAVDLGQGSKPVAVAAGDGFTCALLEGGQVKCWGGNDEGQLGLGDQVARGDQPGEMGDALPALDLGAGRSAVQITAAQWQACALLDNGQVKCWGHNQAGKLGLGDTSNRGLRPGEMGDALAVVDLGQGRTALAVTTAFMSTCALLDTHQVKCWGGNDHGDLGLGDCANRGDEPGEMGDLLPTVNLGSGVKVASLSAGTMAFCVLLDTGVVKCWGVDVTPGKGSADSVGDSPGEMGDALTTIDLGP